ncbi:hypothetical protein PoB_003780500 [Plakobranchus ocellatus]|uniref:Uncharacterized protein n=1 Tax=Plakobranchus ocellatus TaxID=259542 RepID=A0AAV4AVI3_9GAST|nr:hypothetical protein PoB_003780500 [Plakobranchus ocellatus]
MSAAAGRCCRRKTLGRLQRTEATEADAFVHDMGFLCRGKRQNFHPHYKTIFFNPRSVGGTVASEYTLRSAGSLLLRARAHHRRPDLTEG